MGQTAESGSIYAMARLREEVERPPFDALLNLQAVSADADSQTVVLKMQYRPELGQSPTDVGEQRQNF